MIQSNPIIPPSAELETLHSTCFHGVQMGHRTKTVRYLVIPLSANSWLGALPQILSQINPVIQSAQKVFVSSNLYDHLSFSASLNNLQVG